MAGGYSELRLAFARIDVHTLAAGVVSQAALLPVILYGGAASRSGRPAILAATYALEAVFFLSLGLKRSRGRNRMLRRWMSATLAHGMDAVLHGPG